MFYSSKVYITFACYVSSHTGRRTGTLKYGSRRAHLREATAMRWIYTENIGIKMDRHRRLASMHWLFTRYKAIERKWSGTREVKGVCASQFCKRVQINAAYLIRDNHLKYVRHSATHSWKRRHHTVFYFYVKKKKSSISFVRLSCCRSRLAKRVAAAHRANATFSERT